MDRRLRRLDVRGAIRAVADLATPRTCLVCGESLMPQESHLCLCCLADLPLTRYENIRRNPMADKFNALPGFGTEPYVCATALFHYEYESGYRQITQALKYRRNFAAGRHFASMLGERMAGSGLYRDVDLVVPVPLHWTRRWRRGYNQAEIIAAELARRLPGSPRTASLLRRRRHTVTQTRLSVEEKTVNVRDAFSVRPRTCAKAGMPGHILLVDDVFTTGATLNACYRALREHFTPEVRISIATLGFVKT